MKNIEYEEIKCTSLYHTDFGNNDPNKICPYCVNGYAYRKVDLDNEN